MPRYALKIEYDGAPFSGWQRQVDHPSVQAAVEAALRRVDPAAPTIAAAGRTDTGVHATGQVAHCDLQKDWSPFRLSEAVNHHLKPAPVAITAVARVTEDWHARFTATGRRYLYRIVQRRAPLTHTRGFVWRVRRDLDIDAMREAGAHLVGHHDFTTFRASMCQAKSPMKSLDSVTIERVVSGCDVEVHLRFAARSFLHNQVRSMVGSLERVGAGAWSPDDLREALLAADRSRCGPVAPPEGLYLTGVEYPEDPFATV